MMFNNENVGMAADEMRSLIRANLGRKASEENIREFFDNYGLDEWIDSCDLTEDEAEEALDIAIDLILEPA